ncbi:MULTISPECIES: hypothetical protein [Moorena]|uniref:Uncharacterized protein n=2 Tax=Moorena producens TaxID=1155739 RepID=A0A9Q9SSM5_MOOP1|nr:MULTISPECIES: hypothetical protein [Moorena]NEQ18415.1 hypothetical protein [Moorena sp. SIO3E2]EGJ30380.1 hypothetical protein LYNGBM3L_51710 [Moorena producens 3L]NER89969.1 hypothetical protein [Moorena sp. SIO3A2]NES46019.1 hypothetical protein [Moorena sp. SIO2C4]NET69425.1 hypothetical protein [Moorena sp. SIO1G6]
MGENPILEETSDSLSGHTEQAATSQSEAGTRAESEVKQISHTAANGEVTRVNKS